MDLTIRKDGKVLDVESEKRIDSTENGYIFFTDGETKNYVDQQYRIRPVTTSGHLDNMLLGYNIVAKTKNGMIEYVKTDTTGYSDVFFSKEEELIKVSSSLDSVARWRGEVKIDEQELAFFRRNGYLKRSKTFFKNIRRVGPKQKLFIKNEEVWIEYCSVEATTRPDYNTFRRVFSESVDHLCDSTKRDIVLLSGGIDSASLLGVLKNKGRDVTAVTMRIHPSNEVNGADIKRSKKVSESVGVPHQIVDINLDDVVEKDFEDVLQNMSTAAHLSVHFKKFVEEVDKKNAQLWTAQNADTLYNLKQTDRGYEGIIKRAIQTNTFLEYIDDNNPSPQKKYVLSLLKKFLSYVYPHIECKTLDTKVIKEILEISTTGDSNRVDGRVIQTVFGRIYQNMLDEYYTGRDNKVWHAIGEHLNTDINLPYSSASMVALFSQVGNNPHDILYPKRYIYKLAKECGAFSYYAHSLPSGKWLSYFLDSSYHMPYKKWEQVVMRETNLGNIICAGREYKGQTPSLQKSLSNYWLKKIFDRYS